MGSLKVRGGTKKGFPLLHWDIFFLWNLILTRLAPSTHPCSAPGRGWNSSVGESRQNTLGTLR
jgi:hypothetical protein